MPQAIPIIIAAAGTAAGAAGAAGVGVLGATIAGTAITYGAVLGTVLSIAASVAGSLLNKPPDARQQTIEAGLPRVEAKPPKRLALGRYKFGGRLYARFTEGRDLYSAYAIASHPCGVGEWYLHIDNRKVLAWTGDPFDMNSGAQITAPETLATTTFWVGDGSHTQAPQAWIDAGVITASDKWLNFTMVWLHTGGGEAKDFNKNFPNGANREVQLHCDGGKWAIPETQTEAYTATPAHIGYALMLSDLGLGYEASDIDAATFANSALIEQQRLPEFGSGTHARSEMNGVIDLTGDRGDFIAAVQAVAASQIVLQGGKWAYLPGVARQSVMTLTIDHIAGPPTFTLIGEPDTIFNTVEGSFVDPTLFTAATNPLYQNTAALLEDNEERLTQPQHPHVTNPYQAQRLDHIGLNVSRKSQSMSASFSGRAIFLTEGDVITTNFGFPMWPDGPAIVRKAKTEISEVDGVPTETNALELRAYDPTDYDPLPVQEYVSPTVTEDDIVSHASPAVVGVTFSGTGQTRMALITVPRVEEAYSVEWEYSLNSAIKWTALPEVVIREEDPVLLRHDSVPAGAVVRWRLRFTGGENLVSPWTETQDYDVPGAQMISEPSGSVASSSATSITIDWLIPDDVRIDSLEIYRSADQNEIDPLQGARVAVVEVDHGTTETYFDSVLMAGTYRYWGRCYGGTISGPWSAPVDKTI